MDDMLFTALAVFAKFQASFQQFFVLAGEVVMHLAHRTFHIETIF